MRRHLPLIGLGALLFAGLVAPLALNRRKVTEAAVGPGFTTANPVLARSAGVNARGK